MSSIGSILTLLPAVLVQTRAAPRAVRALPLSTTIPETALYHVQTASQRLYQCC